MSTTVLASILSADEKKKRYSLLLSGSAFRPSGGGQPGDKGELIANEFLFRVLECEKHPEGVAVSGILVQGSPVSGIFLDERIDMDVRAAFSRMHTGEHILSRVLERANPPLHVYKVAIGEEESTVFFTFPGELRWDILFAAEDEANLVVERNLPVETLFLGREEAERLPGIKGNWGRIADDTIRVVRIPGFDTIACSGSHVSATGEVGDIFVTGFRGASPEWEVKFAAKGKKLRNEFSQVSRRMVRSVGCPLSRLEDVFSGLKDENAALGKTLEKAAQLVSIPWDCSETGGVPLCTAVIPGVPKELVSAAARRWSDAHPEGIALLLLPDLEKEGGSFLLYRGAAVDRDFSRFLKSAPSLEARGGGRSDWLNGASACMDSGAWTKEIERYLTE